MDEKTGLFSLCLHVCQILFCLAKFCFPVFAGIFLPLIHQKIVVINLSTNEIIKPDGKRNVLILNSGNQAVLTLFLLRICEVIPA